MSERRRIFILILIMLGVSGVVLALTIHVLYRAAFREEQARLREDVQSQARLIEALSKNPAMGEPSHFADTGNALLNRIKIAHKGYKAFGETGEFALVQRQGNHIVFLLRHRSQELDHPNPIPLNAEVAKPMRRSLSGEAGIMVAKGLHGEAILAAYEPVKGFEWGIVSQIDLEEIRSPFVRASILAGIFSVLVIFGGTALFLRVSNPIIRVSEQRASMLERMNEEMAREIEERERVDQHVHTLSQQLLRAQEDERQMISRELHDRVAQDLATLKIGLFSLIDKERPPSEGAKAKISRLSRLLERTITTVRDLTYDLRPPALEEMGLVLAVSEYCRDFSESHGIDVAFYSGGVENLNLHADTEINLYRLIQEGLTNIKKHAEATHINVRLVAAYPRLILRIEDDGKGFDVENRPATSASEKKIGLRSMEQRVNHLHGDMRIQSKPSHGTRVTVKIPLRERENGTEEHDSDRG